MLLIIHNLPSTTRYTDLKTLIKEKCGITDVIVDNLVPEGKSKKVTVGLADEGDAAILMQKIDGLYILNNQLFVENVRQNKKNEEQYWPPPGQIHQNQLQQFSQPPNYNQTIPVQINNQFYKPENTMQYQAPMIQSDAQLQPGASTPNFGVPFYMSAPQNQNVGNKQQYMVEYPKLQGHTGNVACEGRDIGFDQQYRRGKGDRSRSPERNRNMERSSRPFSRSNEPVRDRQENRRDRDRSREYNNRHNTDRSYGQKSYSDINSSNQDYGSNRRNRRDSSSNRHESKWDRPYKSTFGDPKESSRGRHNNQDKESSRFREGYPQSRDSSYLSRSDDFSKKRPLESSFKDKFGPRNKKNKQYDARDGLGTSGQSFSNNLQNKKSTYFNKSSERSSESVQNKRSVQLKGVQFQPYKSQIQPTGVQKYDKKPQWQQSKPEFSNNQRMNPKKNEMFSKNSFAAADSNKQKHFMEQSIINKNSTMRFQAASIIISQISKAVGTVIHKRSPIAIKLRECVCARLDVVIGHELNLTLTEMISLYRKKFQDDSAFYEAVLNKVNAGKVQDSDEQKKESGRGELEKKKSDITSTPQSEEKSPAKVVAPNRQPDAKSVEHELNPLTPVADKLPKYPEGNKKIVSQMKQAQKQEMIHESMYTLEAEQEKALCEELDKFEEMMREEIQNPVNDTEKSVSKFMNEKFMPNLRKILTLHTKKRVLNIKTNLSLRINCQPKFTKGYELDAFLKDYGVISLKTTGRDRNVFIAVCDSFENFDALCKVNRIILGNMTVTFKPLHLTGPPVKGKFKNKCTQRSNNTAQPEIKGENDVIDTIKTENDPKGEDNKAKIAQEIMKQEKINSDDFTKENNDGDCEIIPNEKNEGVPQDEVAVIEDNEHKTNDMVVIDVKEDRPTSDDKKIIHDEGATDNLDSKEVTVNTKEDIPVTQSKATDSEKVIIDDNTTSDNKDFKREEQADIQEVIDNENIEDDDLEDF